MIIDFEELVTRPDWNDSGTITATEIGATS